MRKNRERRDWIWEALFPDGIYCIACGAPIKKGQPYALCDTCTGKLLYRKPAVCPGCGRFVKKSPALFCANCAAHPLRYDGGAAAVVYGEEAQRIIHSLKYGGRGYLAKNIADIMADIVPEPHCYDIIIPVPLHKSRKKLRGFCQTSLIAGRLGELTGKPVCFDGLVRRKKTRAMRELDPRQRRANVRDVFAVGNQSGIAGKRVLLIDDLLTTGSTADACAAVLKEAGARQVILAVFASPYKEEEDGISPY